VVLLHGWPQTGHEWRKIVPLLADRYRVIVPDLPGLGASAPPPSYDKKTIARILGERFNQLEPFHLVGHDWGGPTAFALACLAPEKIRTLAILDVTIPGIGPDISQGGRRWHHAFHMTPELPEALVAGREREYLGWFYREFCWQRGAITPADVDEYLRSYARPGAMRSGFEYYRALPQDKADNQALHEAGFRLPMPVLALGGARIEARGRGEEPLESLRAIASNVSGGAIAECGHFIPEEQPAVLAEHLLQHFAR
jgi:pimeloyl-ACP methyl ester carboxylesterase